jgi:hypothetical protein
MPYGACLLAPSQRLDCAYCSTRFNNSPKGLLRTSSLEHAPNAKSEYNSRIMKILCGLIFVRIDIELS